MFLRTNIRHNNGKAHRYFTVVESARLADGRTRQRQVLYLGELNDAQHAGWVRAIEAFEGDGKQVRQLALFPEDQKVLPALECEAVRIRINGIELHRPRQWGGCWLALRLWELLSLDEFWTPVLEPSRKGTRWLNVLKMLVVYRLLDPGSEWRLHRQWFERSAIADLLGEDAGIASKNTLYRCLGKLLPHKEALFSFLQKRWEDLFQAKFDVLLYDLTSTYFEARSSGGETKKKHGYTTAWRFITHPSTAVG